jgi:glycosidase
VLNLFRSLVRLRKQTPALAVGAYRTLSAPDGVFSFERYHPDGRVQVHLNFGEARREVEVPEDAEVLLSTARGLSASRSRRLELRGYGAVIIR